MVVVPPPNRMSKGSRNLSNALLLIFSVAILIGLLVLAIVGAGFGAVHRGDPVGRNRSKASSAALVLYCAQDQDFAEKVIAEFSRKTGIEVRAVYDSELTKTVGLANRLLAERDNPRADVFWGNEELRTRQLADRGVFGTNRIGVSDAGWVAFGARTRRLVVDPQRLPEKDRPTSLIELTNARWKGRVSLAVPMFGTTSTHFHALRAAWGEVAWRQWCEALAANKPFLEPGNSHVVRRVVRGEALVGITDSDDVMVANRGGARVEALLLERDFLVIPNTVALVRPAAPESPARQFLGFVLSAGVVQGLVTAGALESPVAPVGAWLRPDWRRVLGDLDMGIGELESRFRR
jgi:iron(III) transport system substrate-binding protein